MFGYLGGPELLLIFIVGLVVFGPRKLPELGKGLGQAIRGFKTGMHDLETPAARPPAVPTKPDDSRPSGGPSA